jgi:hypothetical protein
MDKTEFKEKLIGLLETEEQTVRSLYKIITSSTFTWCIEGLMCRVLGGTIKETEYNLDLMVLEGKDIGGHLDCNLYSSYLPSVIDSRFILSQTQLNLTESQELKLEVRTRVNWVYLNDTVRFTFPQFIELIKVL